MKKNRIIFTVAALVLSVLLMLSGCTKQSSAGAAGETSEKSGTSLTPDSSDMFTDRDFEVGYDETAVEKVTVSDSNPEIKITKAGTYLITGTVLDGSITVDVPDTDKVQIVLNGVSVTSKTSAALYVKSADKVFVTTLKGTENTLANGGTFTAVDGNNIDGAVFSKSDITFNGEGTLNITDPTAHGIVGKDDVKFTSGTYLIDCASHGIDANDSIRIANAVLQITADKDGLHAENNDDNSKGYVYIASGTVSINAGDDGIHANTVLQTDGGTLNITAAEGLEATSVKINDAVISIKATDDGINAARKSSGTTPEVEINGGKITIVMGQGDTDGIDSNGNITINGGTVDITANSAFDYDGTGVINGGTVIVNGTEVKTLPNQVMGGGMGGKPGGIRNNTNKDMPNDAITETTPETDGGNQNGRGNPGSNPADNGSGSENGAVKSRPQRPDKNA